MGKKYSLPIVGNEIFGNDDIKVIKLWTPWGGIFRWKRVWVNLQATNIVISFTDPTATANAPDEGEEVRHFHRFFVLETESFETIVCNLGMMEIPLLLRFPSFPCDFLSFQNQDFEVEFRSTEGFSINNATIEIRYKVPDKKDHKIHLRFSSVRDVSQFGKHLAAELDLYRNRKRN